LTSGINGISHTPTATKSNNIFEGAKSMSTQQNKAIMNRLFSEAFNKNNLQVVDEIISEKWALQGPQGMNLKGPEGFKQFLSIYRNAFPDFRVNVKEMIAEGDMVVSVGSVQGTFNGSLMGFAPTGKPFSVIVVAISRFDNGKEVEVLEVMDNLALFQQIGLIPSMTPGKK
jgi:predicted ester cyclase